MDSWSHAVARLQGCPFNPCPDSVVSKVLRTNPPLFAEIGEEERRQLDVLSSRCLVSRCVWVRHTKETHCEGASEYKAVPRPHGKCHSVTSTGTERNFTLSLLSHFLQSLIF